MTQPTEHAPTEGGRVMTVIEQIAEERRHQIEDNGFDAKHDDQWVHGDLVSAAICYVRSDFDLSLWPWDEEWWKDKGYRQNMIRGIALLVAEVERYDRLNLSPVRNGASE